jgi:hypothetical protein
MRKEASFELTGTIVKKDWRTDSANSQKLLDIISQALIARKYEWRVKGKGEDWGKGRSNSIYGSLGVHGPIIGRSKVPKVTA